MARLELRLQGQEVFARHRCAVAGRAAVGHVDVHAGTGRSAHAVELDRHEFLREVLVRVPFEGRLSGGMEHVRDVVGGIRLTVGALTAAGGVVGVAVAATQEEAARSGGLEDAGSLERSVEIVQRMGDLDGQLAQGFEARCRRARADRGPRVGGVEEQHPDRVGEQRCSPGFGEDAQPPPCTRDLRGQQLLVPD